MQRQNITRLLRQLLDELHGRIESGTLPRELRSEARRLALAAWLALSSRRTVNERVRLSRQIDGLLAMSGRVRTIHIPVILSKRWTCIRTEGVVFDNPIVTRLDKLEKSIFALVSKTDRMIEKLDVAAGQKTEAEMGATSGKREKLELVWGEGER